MTTRDLPPTPEFQPPECPVCDGRTEFDIDCPAVECRHCGIRWPADTYYEPGSGEWIDPNTPQCPAEHWQRLLSPPYKRVTRCCLPQGHGMSFHIGTYGHTFVTPETGEAA